MFQDRVFSIALLVSVLFHAVLLWFLPGVNFLETVRAVEWLEVDLLVAPEVDIQVASGGSQVETGEDGVQSGNSELFPSPPVWVPERLNTVRTEPMAMRLVVPTDNLPKISGPGLTTPEELLEVDSGNQDMIPDNKPPELPWKPSQQTLPSPDPGDQNSWQITGEVALRKVTYRPPAPRPETSISGTVVLKFWVLPDGTIAKIVPIMRSDPEVERVASEYLQKWRFEAIDESVGRQSGKIPIRFKIR